MSKRITYVFIKKQFEDSNYKLLSTDYINCKHKLSYICDCGHKHEMCWNKWQQGRRCPTCKAIKLSKSRMGDGNPMYGRVLSDEHKMKLSLTNKNKYVSIETRRKLSEINKGRKLSEKTKRKLSKIHMGKKLSERHKRKISETNRKSMGSEKHRKRMSILMSGENNPMFGKRGKHSPGWKGGISCEPYCDVWLDKDFKESIKQRDGYRCMNSNCWKTSKRLSIHHIDYIKKNCNPNNLITLCTSCNSRANKDREWHTAWYQAIMYRRYGYRYE